VFAGRPFSTGFVCSKARSGTPGDLRADASIPVAPPYAQHSPNVFPEPRFPQSPMATTAYRRFSAVLCHGHLRLSGAGGGGPPTPAPCAAYDLSSRMVARSSLSGQEDTTRPIPPMLAKAVPLRCPRTRENEGPGVIHWPSTALAGEPLSAQNFCGFPGGSTGRDGWVGPALGTFRPDTVTSPGPAIKGSKPVLPSQRDRGGAGASML
jgi:hypothetical protein